MSESVTKLSDLDLFETMFDEFISIGKLRKDVRLNKNLTITIETLSAGDQLDADSLVVANRMSVPVDVVVKARNISTIVKSTVAYNGKLIGPSEEEKQAFRDKFHTKLLESPPALTDKLVEAYMELQEEQRKIYEDVGKKVENF